MPNKKPVLVSTHGKTVDQIANELFDAMTKTQNKATKKTKPKKSLKNYEGDLWLITPIG